MTGRRLYRALVEAGVVDGADVEIALLTATCRAAARLDRPLITMAMGGLGLVTRLVGEVFGSAATFGMVGRASAPGQVEAQTLRGVVELIHQGAERRPAVRR